MVLNVEPSAVAEHDERGIELPYLVQKEIFDHEPDEVTLVVLYVLFSLHHLRKALTKGRKPHWKNIEVLVEVLPSFVVFTFVQFLCAAVIVLWVEHQSLHSSQCPVILT